MAHRLTAHLMGGLGNQMFEYAAARALARRNSAHLSFDTRSGFARDKVFKRTYELDAFPIQGDVAGMLRIAPFFMEAARGKLRPAGSAAIRKRFYGTFIAEPGSRFLREVADLRLDSNAWMRGYWQSEKYFEDCRAEIVSELSPPAPTDSRFVEMAARMRSVNSVAVGVRLFEEVPGASKAGVGGLTSMSFFPRAARLLCREVPTPEFFVFCTHSSPDIDQLQLPGRAKVITHDNGFTGSIARLWLASQCKHHIISNSSFYWWSAWLAEARDEGTRVIASPLFSNRDTIPSRWRVLATDAAAQSGAVLE